MAQVTLRLVLEPDLYNDAVRSLVGMLAGVQRRHGDKFRALERRIEALAENLPPADLRELGLKDDTLIILALPPAEMTKTIAEARRLQVRPIFER